MTRLLILFLLPLFFFTSAFAQTVPDSAAKDTTGLKVEPAVKDSTVQIVLPKRRISNPLKDSVAKESSRRMAAQRKLAAQLQKDSDALSDSDIQALSTSIPISQPPEILSSLSAKESLSENPDFNFLGKGQPTAMLIHQAVSYDSIFYLLVGILFYFAFFKVLFSKYLRNLFTLFFLVSMRQQQIREQVLQSPLPSLLLNILFLISGGLYVSFLIRYYQLAQNVDFWILLIDSVAVLSLLYICKFLFLKFSGWIFKISRATDLYIFIIFLTNKVLGIFLLPFLLLLSFSSSVLREVSITASLVMVAIFFGYRFIVSFNPVRKEIKVRGFHFFLYLCAFELAPLLLIYKVLLSYLEKTY